MWSVTTEFTPDSKANLYVCVHLYYSGYNSWLWSQIEVGWSPALPLSSWVVLDKVPSPQMKKIWLTLLIDH